MSVEQDELKGLRCIVDITRDTMEQAIIRGMSFPSILQWKLEQVRIELQGEYDKTWKDYLEGKKDELTRRDKEQVKAFFAAREKEKAAGRE